MATITLRDVIEVYEEKLRDIQRKMGEAKQKANDESSEWQQALNERQQMTIERAQALECLKACRGKSHVAFAAQFEDEYPYRRRQR